MADTDIRMLRQALRNLGRSDRLLPALNGNVKSVDEGRYTCEVLLDDGSIITAALTCGEMAKGIVQIPKLNSDVVVICFDKINSFVVICDEIDRIIINGGELGGLVKIQELTDKINELVDVFNSHSHDVATTGTAAAQTGIASPITSPAIKFNKNDYENSTITQ
jgi:hypothetical protein